jgi:hypothetical protein
MSADEKYVRNLKKRVARAKNFPENTCPASRHLEMIAQGLLHGGYPRLVEDPKECAATMLSVLESLWKARNELAAIQDRAVKSRDSSASVRRS